MKKVKKLYTAESVVYDSNNNNGIHVIWYNADIKTYPVNYENIIKNYEWMSPEERYPSVMYVYELFTYDQLKLLEKFLEKEFGIEVYYEELNLPINTQVMSENGKLRYFRGLDLTEGIEGSYTVQLNKLDNYTLPFNVKGFYIQDDSTPSNDILDKLKTNNIQFPAGAYLSEGAMIMLLEEIPSGDIGFTDKCKAYWIGQ